MRAGRGASPPARFSYVPISPGALMQRPLAVYVTRNGTGEFVQALISRAPPASAEVHLRTHDLDEARAVARRLSITLATVFDAKAHIIPWRRADEDPAC